MNMQRTLPTTESVSRNALDGDIGLDPRPREGTTKTAAVQQPRGVLWPELERGNFRSVADLREKILRFKEYFNRTFAKPFKWTYTGRPLNT
jgi:hypothetical protein